ncbi:NnrS family protein [Notoacmeibacter sp. MSK16QG-6]|uniref:NnrS family protein n=1 Tax=Notoacmeibacter sp. MSK16QG-6 TaxID=2957982 RepID=UPI00209CB524|nr:NnrS family protein [Notoacmeibacter sp. MSK16QG-6]MCP1200511.1 NnrS family protein [Notoacmeibacter sp. MSK16QG-6]
MTLSSAEQIRRWRGPALLSYGFRPFFLFGALWAGFAMIVWIAILASAMSLPSRFDPVSWHAHAFLFGYLSVIIAGFLLTAVPNWTGRLPVVGWPLGLLTILWLAGRVAILFSAHLLPWLVAVADLSFTILLGAMILREIVAGKNWRNLTVLALLAVFTLANLLYHLEAAWGGYAASGMGIRLGLGAALTMVALVGGRIIPSFTRNWLVQQKSVRLPVPPMQRFDKVLVMFSAATLSLWVLLPHHPLTGLALILIGVGHLLRLVRWQGILTHAEALVAILHIAYLFVPLGAVAVGAAILWPDLVSPQAAQHLWMAGAIGTMTLAVMTRATLGHTGHPLHADRWTIAIYLAIVGATALRFLASFVTWPLLVEASGVLWCIAFFGFVALYGPLLLRQRRRSTAG